ncbi:MAG: hypothetical protein JNN06_02470 [Gemmobacter sp.]|uniref:hypothetical protein n=1 Tax=Gemmobacter sp. TaxID=1898957 RepID=UPI001A43CB5E|nr:hypothetical protein [Gemmobacter sp.]MBL8561121.1 hypothetical protein [Gemmobacter sp.]
MSLPLAQTRPDTGHAIQPAIWPEAGISTETIPYARLGGAAGMSLSQGGIVFGPGGTAAMDGYFNLFNLGKWRDLCGDTPIALWLRGQGRFQLVIWLATPSRSWDRIYSEAITLDGTLDVPLDLSEATGARAVMFFELTALGEGHLADFAWTTSAAPRRTPDLVLSVTTFKREQAVTATVERFRKFRARSPLCDHIRMFLVDNGQSVEVTSGEGVTVFPNANLGGAGGFTRGLMEARKAGASHCLFMDDDASVHMGAITRTWMLLAYATDPRTAVAGAMINADHRWQIWENGAVFDRGCRPLFAGCDLRSTSAVLAMEFETTGPAPQGHYAGWWFFAFPVAQAVHLAFPFFVRGDDVSFSLVNDFRIASLPGVASFQESFSDKASPQTWYLDMRSHLAHHLSLPARDVGWSGLQRMFFSFYRRTVLRYHYDSLSAVNLAIEDVLRGPQFFAEHADMAERRKDLKALTTTEAWAPIGHAPAVRLGRAPRPLRALLLATLNGHLLPLGSRFGSDLVLDAPRRDDFRMVYGARRITYLNAQKTAAYTVRRDFGRFWRESLRLLRNSLTLRSRYKSLQAEWQGAYGAMTSTAFWEDKLSIAEKNPAAEAKPEPGMGTSATVNG